MNLPVITELRKEEASLLRNINFFEAMSYAEAREVWQGYCDYLETKNEVSIQRIGQKLGQKVPAGTRVEKTLSTVEEIGTIMLNFIRNNTTPSPEQTELIVNLGYAQRLLTREIMRSALDQSKDIIKKQLEAIKELSVPVVEVWDSVLTLPVIGTLDSYRVRTMMEELLTRIVSLRAKVVIIDITGVPVADTETASYLLQTAKAARLLGAEVVITGISPYIAQTLVQLGVDLGSLVTKATLKSGLEYAFMRLGFEVKKQ